MSGFKDIMNNLKGEATVTRADGTRIDDGGPVNDCSLCGAPVDGRMPYPNKDCPVCRGTGVYPSKVLALVAASDEGDGVVLEHNGALYFDIEENGLRTLDDIGLNDAPVGLSVFEGRYSGGGYDSYNGDCNDVDLEGTFRDLTRAEWDAIIEKKCIF